MADSSVNTGAAGAPIRVLTALGTGSADQQVVTLADSAGNLLGTTAAPVPVTGSGTAGTPATGVQTVQGIASGTALPVTGTFWQATQPVSLATNAPVIATGANSIGTVGLNNGANQIGYIGEMRASTLVVTATAAVTTAATVTLPIVSSSFHYITQMQITAYSSAARTGAAAPWVVTSTNLPGSPAWTFSTAGAIGTNETQMFEPTTPLRSSVANTATTIVAPAATGVIWRINVTYFTGA